MKGVSPLIASVLLVAFTMAVAVIVVVWITGFTQTQSRVVSERGENQTKCAVSTFSVDKNDVKTDFTSWAVNSTHGFDNITFLLRYISGTEVLNITDAIVRTDEPAVYTLTMSQGREIRVGSLLQITLNFTNGTGSNVNMSGSLKELRVNAMCAKQFPVLAVVKW